MNNTCFSLSTLNVNHASLAAMPQPAMSQQSRDRLLNDFNDGLAQVRTAVLEQLCPSDSKIVWCCNSVDIICQRLEMIQHDFRAQIIRHGNWSGGSDPAGHASLLSAGRLAGEFLIWKVASNVVVAVAIVAVFLLNLAPAGILMECMAGLALVFFIRKTVRPLEAKVVHALIISPYDKAVVPKLREWACKQLSNP